MTDILFATAPTLETDRLILRPHMLADFEAYAAMFQQPEFTRHTTGRPLTREDAWTKMIRHGGHWMMLGHGYWAVALKSTGEFIGEVGFADFKRQIAPSLEGKLEAGWGLLAERHGRGYADEALKAALNWAGMHFPGREIVCMIAPENAASLRLADRNGFMVWTKSRYKTFDTLLLKRG